MKTRPYRDQLWLQRSPARRELRARYRPIWSVYRPGSALLLLFLVVPVPGERIGDQPQLREDAVLAADEQAGVRGRACVWSP